MLLSHSKFEMENDVSKYFQKTKFSDKFQVETCILPYIACVCVCVCVCARARARLCLGRVAQSV